MSALLWSSTREHVFSYALYNNREKHPLFIGNIAMMQTPNPTLGVVGGASLATASALMPQAGAAYAPPVQIRTFEPAFYSPQTYYSVLPYQPSTISIVTPVHYGSTASGVVPTAAAAAGGNPSLGLPPPPPSNFAASSMGPCSATVSQLPPNGFAAWQPYLQYINQPYNDLFGSGTFVAPCQNGCYGPLRSSISGYGL